MPPIVTIALVCIISISIISIILLLGKSLDVKMFRMNYCHFIPNHLLPQPL